MADAAARRCAGCGGWGKGVVKLDTGYCDHCRRTRPAAAGQKRPRPAEDGDAEDARQQELSSEEIQRLLAEADALDAPELDSAGVRKMLLQLEKRISTNLQQRSKHADEPKAYLASEIDLDAQVKTLQALAAAPQEYPTLVSSGSLDSLMGLLAHENSDIAIGVLQLFSELMKEDAVGEEYAEEGVALGQALLQSAALLVAGLCRLNEEADANDAVGVVAGCELLLSLVDTLGGDACEALGAVTAQEGGTVGGAKVAHGTPMLLAFLLARVSRKEMDDIKGLCAELLAVFLSSFGGLSPLLGSSTFTYITGKGQPVVVDGVEYVLQVVNTYKKKQADQLSSAEKEVVENVMDALATLLLDPSNQSRFLAAEGYELLLRAVHENGYARAGALTALDSSLLGNQAGTLAFVEAGGLKALFPAFMGKGLAQTRRWHGAGAGEGEEGRCVGTLSSLLSCLLPAAGAQTHNGQEQQALHHTPLMRLLVKFGETGGEKVDRLLELRAKYGSAVEAGAEQEQEQQGEGEADEDGAASALYSRRVKAGLYTLQRIDLTLARLLTLPHRLSSAGAANGSAAAGADGKAQQDLLALASSLSAMARAKLYEQGASIVALLDTLQEEQGERQRLSSDGGASTAAEHAEAEWLLSTLVEISGI